MIMTEISKAVTMIVTMGKFYWHYSSWVCKCNENTAESCYIM